MNKFKVGQRVWLIDEEKYATITKIEPLDERIICYYNIQDDDFEGYWTFDISFHETADDMFDKLGYRKILEDSSYIIYNYHNYEDGYITELRIGKEKNKYKLTNFTNNNQAFSAWADKLLHLAIHQKMIEEGWLK